MSKLRDYAKFLKIEHTIFSLPLIYSGALLALGYWPPLRIFLLVLVAGVSARTVAMSLNRLIDKKFDGLNPRTANRELPSGKLSLGDASGVIAVGTLIYLLSAWAIAPICFWVSPVPLIIFMIYPYMKRFTKWAHIGVGAGLAMAPLGGWLAIMQTFEEALPGLVLMLFTFFWVSGFDIIYSTMDADFDRSAGLKSLPSVLGNKNALRISGVFHLAAFACLVWIQVHYLAGTLSQILLGIAAVLLFLEHRKASDVEFSFFKINALLGFVILGWIWSGVS